VAFIFGRVREDAFFASLLDIEAFWFDRMAVDRLIGLTEVYARSWMEDTEGREGILSHKWAEDMNIRSIDYEYMIYP
jgi:hypothetical protein